MAQSAKSVFMHSKICDIIHSDPLVCTWGNEQWTSLKKQLLHGQFTEKGLATHNEEFSLQSLKLLEYFGIKTKILSMYIQQKDVKLQPIPSIIDSKAQYFYSFKASYKASYEASQMFCFDYTVL